MSQLSETTKSSIGAVYLTDDATADGEMHLVEWRTADWRPVRRTQRATLQGPDTNEANLGGASGTRNWPVELFIPGCTDVLFAALEAQCDATDTTYAASLTMAATDGTGTERTVAFTALRWLDLRWTTGDRIAGRIIPGVLCTLISEA